MELTEAILNRIREDVYDFFSEECEIDKEQINDQTNIIEELNGDSLMFLELITRWKNHYKLDVELREIGKYLTKNPADTIGKVVDLAGRMIEKGSDFAN